MHPLGSHLHALRALPLLRLPHARDRGEVRAGTLGHSSSSCYSCNDRWTAAITIDPSPTADAARLTLPLRTSPSAVGRRTPWARSDCTVALCEDGEDVVACARRMGDVTLLVRPLQPPGSLSSRRPGGARPRLAPASSRALAARTNPSARA